MVFVIQKLELVFLFKPLFLGLSFNSFMVYYFIGVVKHIITQMEIQSHFELTMYAILYLLEFK